MCCMPPAAYSAARWNSACVHNSCTCAPIYVVVRCAERAEHSVFAHGRLARQLNVESPRFVQLAVLIIAPSALMKTIAVI